MGVITTEHLDDSELTEEELSYWRVHVRESLGAEYLKRLRQLQIAEAYPRDADGWERLKAHAWQETIENNEICKTISAISAERRAEREWQQGMSQERPQHDDVATEAAAEPASIDALVPVSSQVHALRAHAIGQQH